MKKENETITYEIIDRCKIYEEGVFTAFQVTIKGPDGDTYVGDSWAPEEKYTYHGMPETVLEEGYRWAKKEAIESMITSLAIKKLL